jgi:hypothetical protein
MNHFIAIYFGALFRWVGTGFSKSYIEIKNEDKNFIMFFSKNAFLGYIVTFIIVIIIGYIVKIQRY